MTNQRMVFDLHVHAKLSRAIPFQMSDLDFAISQAKERGLAGFALTEHINAPDYWDVYRLIAERFLCQGGVFHVQPRFSILNGAEITLRGKGDVLAIGDMDAVRQLDQCLDLNRGYHPTLEELVHATPQDILLIAAHPFRPAGGVLKFSRATVTRLHALEINGKDLGLEHRTKGAASDLSLPVVGGSDAHYWPQVGIRATSIPTDRLSITVLKRHIVDGAASTVTSPDAPLMLRICSDHKKRVKKGLGLYDTPETFLRSLEEELFHDRQSLLPAR